MNERVRTWPALDIHPVSELLQAALDDYDASAVDERSGDDWRVFFTSEIERDRAAAALQTEFPSAIIESVDVPDENWAARSQASLRAVRVGNVVVAPPWDVPAGPKNRTRPTDNLVIVIQPSMGFGTGHHATTRLCIDALQRLNVAGRTVLDVGTGSGVLAIAASLLGASRSVGIDDDADAITAAQENLELNPEAEATLLVADLRAGDLGSADVVIANLTGGLLAAAARTLQDFVAPGGSLVLSGLMAVEENDVLATFSTWKVEGRSEEDEWVCLVLERSAERMPVMTASIVLVATWSDGLFVVSGETRDQELVTRSVRALAPDGQGGALAIVAGGSIRRRAPDGVWTTIASTEFDLSCCVAVGDVIYVGTDDARVLRVDAGGALEELHGFDAVAGRDTWYAGSAVINGERVGPPLGIRSITATADGSVLLANVHVGGIPRSTDGGATWQSTIDVDSDVHEVRAHPHRPDVVMAAAAIGLCTSRNGGVAWEVEREGLHAAYCSAVAFAGDDILVSASEHHFAAQGAVYRRQMDGHDSLVAVGGGLPAWTEGIVDTGCIATRGSEVAVADAKGNLYVSADTGRSWSRRASGLSAPSSVLIV